MIPLPGTIPLEQSARRRWREAFVAVVISSVILGFATNTSIDPDLWGHLRFGLDILDQRQIHTSDPYSFTSDRRWINHEWLAELALAISYRAAGAPGLLGLKLLLVIAAGYVLYTTLRIRASALQSRYLMVLPMLALLPQTQSVRPQLFSILAFAVLLRLGLKYYATHNGKYLLGMPLLFCFWANVHGGWVLGEATLFALLAPVAARVSGRKRLVIAVAVVAAAAAPLVNPYGAELYRFLTETLSVGRPEITEWQSVLHAGYDSIALWLATVGVAAYSFRRGYWRRYPLFGFTILIFAVLAFQVVRLVGFAALVTSALVSVDGNVDAEPAARSSTMRLSTPELLVLAAAMCASLALAVSNLRCLRPTDDWAPAAVDATYIRAALPAGRLLAWFNWGEYAIWHFGPSVKVSFDGRRETTYSQRFIAAHMNLYAAGPNWRAFMDRLDPDLVWLPPALPLAKALAGHGWQVVHRTPESVILSKTGQHHPSIRPTAMSVGRCFPAP